MKKIILIFNSWEEYSAAYKKYQSEGLEVSVVAGLENAISIEGSQVAWLDITNANVYGSGCSEILNTKNQ